MTTSPTLSIDSAELPAPAEELAFLPAVFSGLARRSTIDTAGPRERFLSQAVDHEDLERRIREWDAHQARVRGLPPVL
jgi:hypothetical protein